MTQPTTPPRNSGRIDDLTSWPNWFVTALYGFGLLTLDVIFYGCFIPYICAYFGGRLSTIFDLRFGPIWESIMVMFCVFCFLGILFKGVQESLFWRHFFAGENGFMRILQIRDLINTFTLIYCCYRLLSAMQKIILFKGMNSKNLHEAVMFVTLRPFFDDIYLEHELHVRPLAHPEYSGLLGLQNQYSEVIEGTFLNNAYRWLCSIVGQEVNILEQESKIEWLIRRRDKAILSAEFLIAVAQLTAAITKLIYFNSLYAYHRAMNIFINMQRDGELGSIGTANENPLDFDENPGDDNIPLKVIPLNLRTNEISPPQGKHETQGPSSQPLHWKDRP